MVGLVVIVIDSTIINRFFEFVHTFFTFFLYTNSVNII